MADFFNKIVYTDSTGEEITLDQSTSVATVDASTLSVANAKEAQHAVNADNATNANHATSADSATKATQDGNGKNIASTYATLATLTSGLNGKANTSGSYLDLIVGEAVKLQGEVLFSGTWDPTQEINTKGYTLLYFRILNGSTSFFLAKGASQGTCVRTSLTPNKTYEAGGTDMKIWITGYEFYWSDFEEKVRATRKTTIAISGSAVGTSDYTSSLKMSFDSETGSQMMRQTVTTIYGVIK